MTAAAVSSAFAPV
ncbi:hypothetical protein D021_1926A, partial [Vibrio parahaemolyticus 10296]